MMLIAPVETPRLRLRNLTADDCGATYVGWLNDPAVNRYLESRHVVHTAVSVAAFVERSNNDHDTLLLGLFLRAGGMHIGNIKIGPVRRPYPVADVGIMIGERQCFGQGFAREAIAAVSVIGFGLMGLQKLAAGMYVSNQASERAFLACGYRREGLHRHAVVLDGVPEDVVSVGLTQKEHRQRHLSSPDSTLS